MKSTSTLTMVLRSRLAARMRSWLKILLFRFKANADRRNGSLHKTTTAADTAAPARIEPKVLLFMLALANFSSDGLDHSAIWSSISECLVTRQVLFTPARDPSENGGLRKRRSAGRRFGRVFAEVEDVQSVQQAFGLGICIAKDERQAAVLAGDVVAAPRKTCCEKRGDSKTSWFSHIPSHLHDPLNAKQRGRE